MDPGLIRRTVMNLDEDARDIDQEKETGKGRDRKPAGTEMVQNFPPLVVEYMTPQDLDHSGEEPPEGMKAEACQLASGQVVIDEEEERKQEEKLLPLAGFIQPQGKRPEDRQTEDDQHIEVEIPEMIGLGRNRIAGQHGVQPVLQVLRSPHADALRQAEPVQKPSVQEPAADQHSQEGQTDMEKTFFKGPGVRFAPEAESPHDQPEDGDAVRDQAGQVKTADIIMVAVPGGQLDMAANNEKAAQEAGCFDTGIF